MNHDNSRSYQSPDLTGKVEWIERELAAERKAREEAEQQAALDKKTCAEAIAAIARAEAGAATMRDRCIQIVEKQLGMEEISVRGTIRAITQEMHQISLNDCGAKMILRMIEADQRAKSAEAQVKVLREFVEKIPHKPKCELREYKFSDKSRAVQKCTCGRDAALAATEGTTPESWIKCSERLPAIGHRVMVWIPLPFSHADIAERHGGINVWTWDNDNWHRPIHQDGVTHWMPLLEPPKAAEGEEQP